MSATIQCGPQSLSDVRHGAFSQRHAKPLQGPEAPASHGAAAARSEILARVASGALDPYSAARALDEASSLDADGRKSSGVVYTPERVAKAMADLAAPGAEETILEPACGRGVFAFALAERELASGSTPARAAESLARRLCMADLDPLALEDFKLLWSAWWASKGLAEAPVPETVQGDTLFGPLRKRSFGLCLGNPPYVRIQNLPAAYRAKLQGAFESAAKGNVDLYHAFCEFALRRAKRCCMVVPNSWMSSRSGAALRALLRPRLDLLADFGSELVFAPVRAYACVFRCSELPPESVFLSQGLPESPADMSLWRRVPADSHLLSGPRWRVDGAPEGAFDGVPTLGSLAKIHSGTCTQADSAFKVRQTRLEGGRVFFDAPDGSREMSVPAEFAPRWVKMTKAKSEADLLGDERILCPYGPDGKLVPEAELRESAPDLLEALAFFGERLAARDGGRDDKREAWYAYGRRQGLAPLPGGKLVALSGMSCGRIEPFAFDSAAAGKFLFASGFVLSPLPGVDAARVLQALRDPRLWEWMLEHGKEWASSGPEAYRSYGARLLASAPAFESVPEGAAGGASAPATLSDSLRGDSKEASREPRRPANLCRAGTRPKSPERPKGSPSRAPRTAPRPSSPGTTLAVPSGFQASQLIPPPGAVLESEIRQKPFSKFGGGRPVGRPPAGAGAGDVRPKKKIVHAPTPSGAGRAASARQPPSGGRLADLAQPSADFVELFESFDGSEAAVRPREVPSIDDGQCVAASSRSHGAEEGELGPSEKVFHGASPWISDSMSYAYQPPPRWQARPSGRQGTSPRGGRPASPA